MELGFITWDMLRDWGTFSFIVYTMVQIFKNLGIFGKIDTHLITLVLAFILLVVFNIHDGTFRLFDMVIYVITAALMTVQNTGVYDVGDKIKTIRKGETNMENKREEVIETPEVELEEAGAVSGEMSEMPDGEKAMKDYIENEPVGPVEADEEAETEDYEKVEL